jgi:ATP-dependent DNA helicase DinG
MLAQESASALGDSGPLAAGLAGFRPRPVQQRMAEAVAEALESGARLLVEAGTGTGKTYAYLVPALACGRRVVISTGTLNLQDQLFERDLPQLLAALRVPARVSLLKGRANYLCRHRLNLALTQAGLFQQHASLREIELWAQRSEAGEVQELALPDAERSLLPQITSTAENCLGSRCGEFERCFVVKARRAALAADVVVVNHHLLLADFVLKDEGFGEILPGAEAVIVDEAHLLPELGTRFFGVRLSTRQLQDLAQDCEAEARQLRDCPDLLLAAERLSSAATTLAGQFFAGNARQMMDLFLQGEGAARAVAGVGSALAELAIQLAPMQDRNAGLAACAERAADCRARLDRLQDPEDRSLVRWVEPQGRGGMLMAAPIQPAEHFQRLFAAYPAAWVLTSATLAVGEDFSAFAAELGLEDARTLKLDSPFDYPAQARLYCPTGLPNPNDPGYTAEVIARALPIIEAARGGVFMLCTSHRALQQIAQSLQSAIDYPLFVQGETSRAELIRRFAEAGNGVLVGTSSFWQGVDVRGPALRVVIIDKLPFASPGDPVFEARLNAIREAGGDPFPDYQLPQAIMNLRQGIGRLIRDGEDRGLVMICDPRLRGRGYGKRILASLPPMPLVADEAEARSWLRELVESPA